MAVLIAGERNPRVLTELARPSMSRKTRYLEAFTRHSGEHHRFLLTRMQNRIDGIDADLAAARRSMRSWPFFGCGVRASG